MIEQGENDEYHYEYGRLQKHMSVKSKRQRTKGIYLPNTIATPTKNSKAGSDQNFLRLCLFFAFFSPYESSSTSNVPNKPFSGFLISWHKASMN